MMEESLLYRMRWWKWLLLLVLSLGGTLLMYGIACVFPMAVKNPVALGVFCLLACAAMCVIYAFLSKQIEKRDITELDARRLLPDLSVGCLYGGGCMVLSALVMWLLGVYKIDTVAPVWKDIIDDFFLFVIVAVGEELAFRAVLQRMIEERWGSTIALVVSSLIFGFVHYMNENGTVWGSIGIAVAAVEAASFIYSRTLWMPIGAHLAWNFLQGNVFGLAVSGTKMSGTVIQPALSGPEILTGGAFGAEASIITVVISAAVTAWLIYLAVKRGNYITFRNPWKRQPQAAISSTNRV